MFIGDIKTVSMLQLIATRDYFNRVGVARVNQGT
jgi:hypothetical protein